jgi:hypothetical protein
LEITYKETVVKGNQLLLEYVYALGTVATSAGKTFTFSIRIPDFDEKPQNIKLRLLPGMNLPL